VTARFRRCGTIALRALTLSEGVGYTEGGEDVLNADFAQWANAIQMVIALVLSVAVHEFGHAWVATRLGDSLPRLQGRLTLNPAKHADLVGTIIIPLMGAMNPGGFPMLGWGKPVQTRPETYSRSMSRLTGSMLVAIAGPAMNLLLALVASIILVIGVRAGIFIPEEVGWDLLKMIITLNLSLFFLNLLPIPPLDGGAVLAWVLPRSLQPVIDFLNKWGFIILLALVVSSKLSLLLTPGYIVTGYWLRTLFQLVGQ
jgi:Zn-dependent protease